MGVAPLSTKKRLREAFSTIHMTWGMHATAHMKRRLGPGTKLALGVGAVALALVLVRVLLHEHLEPRAAVALLRRFEHHGWAIPAYLFLYVPLTAAFLPATLFHVAAGVTWGFKLGVLLNILACNGSSTLQFFAARKLGRERVKWLMERKGAAGLDALLAKSGFETVLLIRLTPLPTMAVNVAGGLSSIRWRDFALGSALGTLPVILVYTWFAAALANGLAGTEQQILRNLVIAGACLIALALVPRLVMRWRKRHGKDPLP